MARKTGLLRLALCSATLILCTLTTVQADKCRSGCGGVTPNVFKYQEGTTYKYNLEGNVDIALSSAEGQHTSTKITGTVLLTQQADCNQVLRLQNVQVIGPDAKKYSGLPNIDKPVRLNFHDGHIEPVICADPADTQNSLNVKRAVASLFQAALHNHGDEQDVFGDCPGDISQRKEGNVVVIQKSRDLTKCSNREAIKQDLTSTSFNLKAVAGSGPVFASYESKQRIDNGILNQAVVTENYLYKAFSDGKDHGAKAIVTTKLTYVGTKKENVNAKVSEPRSIYFEAPHQETSKSANVDTILNALKDTKKTMDVSVSERSAQTFYQLIKVLRASKKDDILAVYGQVKTGAGGFKDKEGARKVFFDALFRTGTGDAVEVVVELLKNKELSPIEQKLVYLSFAFIRHATKGSLNSAVVLLDQPDLPREAYLGVGALAGRFCSEHNCHNVEELNRLLQKLAGKLNPQPANRKAENEAISVLKALASVRYISEPLSEKLVSIFNNNKSPARLRVAALEAAASDACHPKLLNAALNLLKNRQEDSELRIKAYLVVAECPNNNIAQGVKEVLESEPVHQVGGYISSHLRNLRASTDPSKERAQQYFSNIHASKKYPIDPRKYSFNTEFSYNWDTLGSANTVEGDIIYSQNSWLPRSAKINITGDVFGHSFNFVEIGARQENLDKVVEHYFGPLGVLAQHSPEEWYKSGKDSVEKIVEHVKQRLEKTRGKRDVSKQEIEAFAKTVKTLGSELNKDLDLDLSVKIFGSELLFLSINEDIQKLTPDAIIDKFFDTLDKGLDKAKNFEYHLKNHLLLTDVEIAYPTSTGFPLRWKIHGTAAVHFITSGQVDVRQILKDPSNAKVHLKLIPSANIEISGGISVDFYFVSTGLKITNNLLTSTGSDITVQLLGNKGIDVKMGLPVEKQKVISFSRTLVFATQELGKPEVDQQLKFKEKPKEFMICFDQLNPILGLTFCGEFNSPSTLATNHVSFPLNGNINLELSIEREDVSEYHFKAIAGNEPNKNTMEVSFNTVGSKTNFAVSLLLEAISEAHRQALRATLKSPWKEAVAEAVYTNSNEELSGMLRFQHDQEYYVKVGVNVKGNPQKQIYQPLIEYSTPSDITKTKGNRKPDYTVEGQVVVEKTAEGQKYTFDHVKLISPGQPPVEVNGYFAKDGPTSFSADLQVIRESVNVAGKGKLQYGANNLKINAELQNSVNPNANFNVKLDLKRGEREFDNSIVLIHGADLSSKKHCLTISQSTKYNYESADQFDFSSKNKLTYPLLGLEGKLDAHANKKHYSYDLTLAYDKFKLESELDAKLASKQVGDYDVKFEVELMNNKLAVEAKREIEGEKSKLHNQLEVSGRKYQVDGIVTHHVKPDDVNVGTDLVVKIHGKPEAIKIDTGLISNLQTLDSHAKILIGSNAVVDIVIKGSRGTNPNGNLKIVIQNVVNANGNFKVTDGKGTGQIVVEVPKIDRKIKAEGQFTCQDPTHNALLNVYFDFEKDNSKKLHIETNNQITKNAFDTKNKIELLSHTLTFNSNGQLTGTWLNGKAQGQFDLTLPNKEVLKGTLTREVQVVDNVVNGNGHITLEHNGKGGEVHHLDFKAHAKDTNTKKGIVDLEWNLVAGKQGGKEVKVDIQAKHNHDDKRHTSLYKSKIYGNVIPQPLETTVEGEYSRTDGTHKASILYGSNTGLKVQGKYNVAGGAQPYVGGLDAEILLPNEEYKNIKLQLNGKAKVPEQPDGVYEADGSISGTLNNKKTVKLSANAKSSIHNGQIQVDLSTPDHEPVGFGAQYSREKTEKGGKLHGEVDLKYAKDKEVKAGLTLIKVDEGDLQLELNLVTPNEHAKNINLVIKDKRSNNDKNINNELVLTIDGKRYAVNNEIVISEINPSFSSIVSYPDGKQDKAIAKFSRLGPKEFKGEVTIFLAEKDFGFDASGEAKLDSVDEFHIVLNLNSAKLNLDHVKFEASNKPAKGGKKIQFSAKSGDKNLLSGSTSYKANEEGGKFIVEGSGSVKVKDETRTATFKYMKQQLQQDKDGEQGLEVLLNAGIGSQGIVGELKLTNKQFRLLNSYCEEKKECAHVEIFSKTNTVDAAEFNHELEINVDLRKLGLSHEFGLKSVTNRKDLTLDHTVDVHFESSASSKYQYSVYVHPGEAGIQVTTPKRVVSLEAVVKASKKELVKAEVALYLNKKAEPNKKTVVSYNSNSQISENAGSSNLEIKFSSPGVAKDLSVNYASKFDVPSKKAEVTIDLDIFAKKNQKLTFTGATHVEHVDGGYKATTDFSASSKGLNFDIRGQELIVLSTKELSYDLKTTYQLDKSKYDNVLVTKANPQQIEVLVKVLSKNVLHVDSSLQLSKESQVADTKISALGLEDLVAHVEVKNFNTIIATIAKKASPQNKIRFSAGLILGQIADVRVESQKGNAKTDIAHASVKLDEANFLKPDFSVNSEYIQGHVIPAIETENRQCMQKLKATAEECQKLLSTEVQHFKELTKKSAPNLKPAGEYYKQELSKLKEELISDKTLQEVSDFLKKIFGAIAGTVADIYDRLNAISEQLVAITSEHFSKITDIIAKDILPQIKEVGTKILDVYVNIIKSLYDLAAIYIVKLSEIVKVHQADLKHLATVASEALQDFGRLFVKFFNHMREDLQVVIKNFYDQIKALPIFEELKERYEELIGTLPVPDQILGVLNEFCATIKDVMPTEETKQFINVVQDYIGRKLRKESVDDTESLKQIYSAFVRAINSLIKFLENQQTSGQDYKGLLDNIVPLRLDRFSSLPELAAAKFSPLNYLLKGDLPSIKQLFKGQSFNPRHNIPPFSHDAVIVQGQHIFTFDDRHLTFPGKCSYVLVKDAVNGNFTLVGQYKDGTLEALTFSDKHDIVTVKKNSQVTHNGQPAELPIRTKELEVFRLYETVQMKSKAGLTVMFEPQLQAVAVTVSGFYHNQLRGLLGNANFEPYDDFTLPNGKITANEADFGNGYKLLPSCGAVTTPDHVHHQANPKCDALFGSESAFRLCYPFLHPEGYRQACEHGLASGIANTERFIALSYALKCRAKGIFIQLPSEYVQCTNSDKPVPLNEKFSVKVPAKSADIVVVVEQNKANEAVFKDLVQPVITQLTNELNAKGINDVEFSLIGYGGDYPDYPSHYTQGGKLSFHGKAATLKFADAEPRRPIDTGCKYTDSAIERFLHIVKEVRYQTGQIPEAMALKEAVQYPFRAQAARAVIFIRGENKPKFAPLAYVRQFISEYSRKDGIHFALVEPLDVKSESGKDAKQLKAVVGFSPTGAFTLADAKKKGEGNTELRKDLDWGLDHWIDYVLERYHGNVFIANTFTNAKGGQKKQYVQVMAHVIAEDIVNTEYGMDCQCTSRLGYFTAKNVCKVVSVKEKEPRKGGVKG